MRAEPKWTVTGRRGAAGLLFALVACSSCMEPERAADDFGTGKASTVTGDDEAADKQADGDDGDDQGDELGADGSADDDAMEVSPDAAVATPAPTATKPAKDAGLEVNPSKPAVNDAGVKPADDAGGVPATADASMPATSGPAPTKLSFSVQTVTLRGRYSPKNIYAIWVVDAQGKFVKTLAKFAFIRATWLTGWNAAAKGNVVDAVTGATQSSHAVRKVTWDLTDVARKPVPDGEYKIVMEMTDADRTGASHSVPFTKGPLPVQLTPPDHANFTGMSLVLE